MQLPSAYTFQRRLHGAGEGVSMLVRDRENNDAVLKTPSETDVDWGGEIQAGNSFSSFEASKRREQKAAAAIPDVVQAGRLETEGEQIFWVRPYWPRTLSDWVAFKQSLTPKRLSSICLAIVRGLAALARFDGGAHGNLSLNNVLVGGANNMELRLVDLLDASEAEPKADKRALGLILYQLVRCEFVEMDRSINHVSTEEDWSKALGKSGDRWKELCNDLLNPYSQLAEADWTEVEERILRLSGGESSRGKWVVLSVLVLGGLGAGLLIFWQNNEDPVTVDPATLEAQWSYVLDQYFGWAGEFLASRRDFELGGSPGAKALVHQFETEGAFGSDKLADLLGRVVPEARALFSSDPTKAEKLAREVAVLELDPADQAGIVLAEEFLTELRENLETWPVVAELRDSRRRFEADGFAFGVERMDRLLDSFDFEGSKLRYKNLFELQRSAEAVENLQRAYQRFRLALQRIESISEIRFGRLYAQTAREALAGLSTDAVEYLEREAARAERVHEAWQLDADRLATELFQNAEEEFLESADPVQEEVVDQWVALLRLHRVMDRDAMEQALTELRGEADSMIAELVQTERQLGGEDASASKFSDQYKQHFENYLENVPQAWIEAERPVVSDAIAQAETRLKQLNEDIRNRLDELKVDISTELAAMRLDTLRLETPVLEAKWRSFKTPYLEGKTADSFDNDREFIDFRRRYSDQRARLEHFEAKVLPELRKFTPPVLESVSGALRDAGSEIWSSIYLDIENAFLEVAADLLFAGEEPWGKIELELEETRKLLDQSSGELSSYLNEIDDALMRYERWKLPRGGLSDWFEELNRTSQRADWSGRGLMRDLLAPLRSALMVKTTEADALMALAGRADGTDAFLRFLALERTAGARLIPVSELDQLQKAVKNLDNEIIGSRESDWSALRKELWQAVYETARTPEQRAACMRASGTFGLVASDLRGRQRFAFELLASIGLLKEEASFYEDRPEMLEEVKNTFQTLPIDRDEAQRALLQKLSGVDLKTEAPTLEEAAFVGKGWQIVEEQEDRKVLEWSGHQQVFYRVEGEEKDFLIAETEMPIGLFMDWMAEEGHDRWAEMSHKVPGEWREFVGNVYNSSLDFRKGVRLWEPHRSGLARRGVRRPKTWFEGALPGFLDSFYGDASDDNAPLGPGDRLAPVSALNYELPMQHTSAELARTIAESMGMRLPLPGEWEVVSRQASIADDAVRVWSQGWSEGLDAGALSEIRLGSFYFLNDIPSSGGGNAEPPLFVPVLQGTSRIKHLAGNVAEYIFDEASGQYFVAGGSALAEVAGSWDRLHPISDNDRGFSFSDVGLRLCFDAPLASPRAQFLDILEKAWQDL